MVMVDLAAEVTVVAVAEEMAVRVAEVLGVGVEARTPCTLCEELGQLFPLLR